MAFAGLQLSLILPDLETFDSAASMEIETSHKSVGK